MKPKTTRGARIYRVLRVLLLGSGLASTGYGLVVMGTDPNLQDAGGFIIGGAVLASSFFQFAAEVKVWDEEERQGSPDRDAASRA